MNEENEYIIGFNDLCYMFRADPNIVRARMNIAGWSLTKALVEPVTPDELEPPATNKRYN